MVEGVADRKKESRKNPAGHLVRRVGFHIIKSGQRLPPAHQTFSVKT